MEGEGIEWGKSGRRKLGEEKGGQWCAIKVISNSFRFKFRILIVSQSTAHTHTHTHPHTCLHYGPHILVDGFIVYRIE